MATAARIRRQLSRLAENPAVETEALLRRAIWRVASRYTPVLAVERDGMRLFVSTRDQIIGRRLFVYHRSAEADVAEAFAALRQLPGFTERYPGSTVLEIGANIGSHTVELMRRYDAGRIVAIEPHPENCALLRQNLLVNGLSDRAVLLEAALSDADGEVELEVSSANSGDHRVRVERVEVAPDARQSGTISVRAHRLDGLIAAGTIDLETVGLVWMDAQGHEAHILAGADALLGGPAPIAMEYWPYGLLRAGGLERLHAQIAANYEFVIDVTDPVSRGPRVLPAGEIASLHERHGWSNGYYEATDLVLARDVHAP